MHGQTCMLGSRVYLCVHGRVPVRVIEDDCVSSSQVHAHAPAACGQDEHKDLGVAVEALHQDLHTHTQAYTTGNTGSSDLLLQRQLSDSFAAAGTVDKATVIKFAVSVLLKAKICLLLELGRCCEAPCSSVVMTGMLNCSAAARGCRRPMSQPNIVQLHLPLLLLNCNILKSMWTYHREVCSGGFTDVQGRAPGLLVHPMCSSLEDADAL